MKKKNKHILSDLELAQIQWDAIQSMPKNWLTDIQVNQLYTKELRSRPQKAVVFWPALGNRLLPDQIKELQWELESDVKTVFIPINNGTHWNFIALERTENSANQWLIKKVETPGDGLCGKHTVTQSMQILEQSLPTYSANNPEKVRNLSQQDPIYPQIQQALKIKTSDDKSSSQSSLPPQTYTSNQTQEDRDTQIAVIESLKFKHMSRFDFKLAKLAEYESLGYSTESLCQELVQMLVEMSPHARESAITRLKVSNLAQKPSISKIIESCHKILPVSANPHLFMPVPKPKPGKVSRLQDTAKIDFTHANLVAMS